MTTLWQPPALRQDTHAAGQPAVSWTELFYDLVFVIAVASLGRRFIEAPAGHALEFVALFGMLWWAWASLTFAVDRYQSNDALARLLAVGQMLAVASFASAVSREAPLEDIGTAVAASYTLTRAVVCAMYFRAWWHIEDSRPLVGGYLRGFGADALLWAASIFVPAPTRYALWGIAMTVSLATPWLMRRMQARSPLSTSHLPERFGLFTILVLGEPVAAVVAAMRTEELHAAVLVSAVAGFVLAVGLWWIYFDNFEGSVVRRDTTREHDWRPTCWIYSHFPLAVGVAAVGHAVAHLVSAEAHGDRTLSVVAGLALALALLALALILLSTAGGDAEARHRRAIARLLGAAVAGTLAFAGASLEAWAYVAALGGVLVAEVLFDVADDLRSRHSLAMA